jgi:dihydroflavonol-4-reductase
MNGRVPAVVRTWVSIVDVADCAEGHVLAAERGEDGERYLLNGASVPVGDLLRAIQRVTGRRRRPVVLPVPVLVAAGAAGDLAGRLLRRDLPLCSEVARTLAHGHRYDGSRAQRELGLTYSPLDETLRRTLAWYVERGLVRAPIAGP